MKEMSIQSYSHSESPLDGAIAYGLRVLKEPNNPSRVHKGATTFPPVCALQVLTARLFHCERIVLGQSA